MNNPGVYTLASIDLTTALTGQTYTAIEDLDGMTAVTLVCAFGYGSGGTTAAVTVQTSADGTTWYDVARFDFATASATKVANLSALLSKAVTSYAALSANTVMDGVLGIQLRANITTTGTYVASTIAVRASVR
jgi:hypothetical protein